MLSIFTYVYCDIVDYINGLNLSDCYEIFQNRSFISSGYYKILSSNGSLISVYCDMEGSNCDGKGGWMRVAYLNMTEPEVCPILLYDIIMMFYSKLLLVLIKGRSNMCLLLSKSITQ